MFPMPAGPRHSRGQEGTASPGGAVHELWSELSATMRSLRESSGMSLREVERCSGRGRGNLSQVETGKARPNRALVEWYDDTFRGDWLLLGLYFEARTGHSGAGRPGTTRPGPLDRAGADEFEVTEAVVPQGALVAPETTGEIGWSLANIGTVDWSGRSMLRVGAPAGPRLLASPVASDVPDCRSGAKVDVRIPLRTPPAEGTCVAYWQMVTAAGASCFAADPYFCVQLVVRG